LQDNIKESQPVVVQELRQLIFILRSPDYKGGRYGLFLCLSGLRKAESGEVNLGKKNEVGIENSVDF